MNRLPRCVSHAPALICIALVLLATVATPTSAQDTEDQDLELFFPLATRRPIIERELEFRVNHFKAGQHRETDVVGAVAAPILPRWQVELELPLVLVQRRDGAATGGIGDLTLENKFLLFKSLAQRVQVAAGFETRLPTGSEKRSLGGEAALEPFVAAGIALRRFEVSVRSRTSST